uniref:Uncharacterized protein n=1 Tax=Rhizophora mucronata TaxID=61149 RepID=A0A2P2QSI0_RHIMU
MAPLFLTPSLNAVPIPISAFIWLHCSLLGVCDYYRN